MDAAANQRAERRRTQRRAAAGIAYFSMEIGLENDIPTYSGGLGILAGDTLRAAADMDLPLVAVSLVHREGYFRQKIVDGQQVEETSRWSPEERLQRVDQRVTVRLEGQDVRIAAWRYVIKGLNGRLPVYLLDTALEENPEAYRSITNQLYGGDRRTRLLQEAVLGLGGVAMLEACGHECSTYHMNEGHSALLGLALVESHNLGDISDALKGVRRHCVFTTHTPVPAGHDQFPMDMVESILGEERARTLRDIGCGEDGNLNMTDLALRVSRYVNGVAMRHRDVSRVMFPNYLINSITNGVHAATWTSPEFSELFDRYIPEWRAETFNLRYAVAINGEEVMAAHRSAKQRLVAAVAERSGRILSSDVFTIGFARRATPYKRADMLFSDPERLRQIASGTPIQILFAGKAHPHDQGGKHIIERIHDAAETVDGDVDVVYLENYDMALAGLLVAGVDLWLNTPQKPQEASGTSGMKAALNGVPSLSVLDGWWVEGHVEGVTGWSIGTHWQEESHTAAEAAMLYDKLQNVILPLYYQKPEEWAQVMTRTIALNGSFFTAQRMVLQYALRAYLLEAIVAPVR
ncbi:MAG TPA: alpha-glucan family phosphorylase [Longimicrobiales bacterium]